LGDKLVGHISETDHLVAFHRNWAPGISATRRDR